MHIINLYVASPVHKFPFKGSRVVDQPRVQVHRKQEFYSEECNDLFHEVYSMVGENAARTERHGWSMLITAIDMVTKECCTSEGLGCLVSH